ncbi:hypothetical protein ZPAH1_orf00080 [Aeromonas phage ZPAH1]|nr:hypothetical protein ZPAH1_orf00080 [Aeromonas phage ZPAH1]
MKSRDLFKEIKKNQNQNFEEAMSLMVSEFLSDNKMTKSFYPSALKLKSGSVSQFVAHLCNLGYNASVQFDRNETFIQVIVNE